MWYELKLKVQKENAKGEIKEVKEHFITDVDLYAEAEYKGMSLYGNNADVFSIIRSKIREIVNDKDEDMPFYKAVITDTFVNDDGTEKETQYPVLICAKNVKEATKLIEDYMSQGLTDMRLDGITKTKIIDVL
jgi:hypothetical protein